MAEHYAVFIAKKSAATEVTARKAQTSTVAKQFLYTARKTTPHISEICVFAKFKKFGEVKLDYFFKHKKSPYSLNRT